jgi:hypothetical protein
MFPRAILIFTKIEREFFAIGQKPRHRRSCKTSGKLGDIHRNPPRLVVSTVSLALRSFDIIQTDRMDVPHHNQHWRH